MQPVIAPPGRILRPRSVGSVLSADHPGARGTQETGVHHRWRAGVQQEKGEEMLVMVEEMWLIYGQFDG